MSDSNLTYEQCEALIDRNKLDQSIITHEILRLDNTRTCVYEIDVPADGNCFYYSMIIAYLFPVINNEQLFKQRFHRLFGDGEQITTPERLRRLLTKYDGSFRFINHYEHQLRLLAYPLRANLARYMQARDDLDMSLFLEDNESPEHYFRRMSETNAWAGEQEITNISHMLGIHLQLYKNVEEYDEEDGEVYRHLELSIPTYSSQNPEVVRLAYVNGDHYRILMNPDAFNLRNQARQEFKAKPPLADNAAETDAHARPQSFFKRHRTAISIIAGALLVATVVLVSVATSGALPAIVAGLVGLGIASKALAAAVGLVSIGVAALAVGAFFGAIGAKIGRFFDKSRNRPKRDEHYEFQNSTTKHLLAKKRAHPNTRQAGVEPKPSKTVVLPPPSGQAKTLLSPSVKPVDLKQPAATNTDKNVKKPKK